MLKKLLLLVVLVFLAPYSYSDSITPYYGQTNNTAANGNAWDMDSYLPSGVPGLDIQNVIYSYTIQKQIQDSVNVHVQNENALNTGYIFRETDSWGVGSLSGTGINKVVPVIPNIPREAWGDGSIEVEGNGSVTDASVIYTYKVEPCYDPQYDPNCPGYKVPEINIPVVDVDTLYDVTKDNNVNLDNTVNADLIKVEDKETVFTDEEDIEDRKERLEKALLAADNSALFAQALSQSLVLQSMNAAINMNSYYAATIDGGEYRDSVTLSDSNIPDNRRALNNMSQQKLHKEMIDMQY
jgi:hypothetical protein